MTRSKLRRAAWYALHPVRAHRAAVARRNFYRYPPRPPSFEYREHFGGSYADEIPEHVAGEAWELPPLISGGYHDTLLAFVQSKWFGRCRHVGPAGYLCTESTYDGEHDVHRSVAPSGEVFDVWTVHPAGEERLDELETEALHLAAGMCIEHYTPPDPGALQYTCTREADHPGDYHESRGPEGEVFAKWPA